MGRRISRLSGLEIDEVSLVNRPANQHGIVAIAKAQEDEMPIYDAEGYELDEDRLEHGDVVYDDDGIEYVFVDEEPGGEEYEDVDDYESQLVGKSRWSGAREAASAAYGQTSRAGNAARKGRFPKQRAAAEGRVNRTADWAGRTAGAASHLPSRAMAGARGLPGRAQGAGAAGWEGARGYGNQAAGLATAHPYMAGGAGAGALALGGGGTYAATRGRRGTKSASLGDEVMEALSKSLTDSDRDEVIAKAMDYMQDVSDRNSALENVVSDILEERETDGYYELAKSYELPADPDEIAGIMYRASQTLPQRDLETLDRVLTAASDVTKGYYEEIGYAGGYESDTMGQIYAAAGEVVAKSGASMTPEQAVTALFQANPDAYDTYESEQARR